VAVLTAVRVSVADNVVFVVIDGEVAINLVVLVDSIVILPERLGLHGSADTSPRPATDDRADTPNSPLCQAETLR
jgi:hypothetical protein